MTPGHFRIRDFELIVALHDEGNMTQAAKRLGITEPALSQQLTKIERRIQTRLFERGSAGVVTTGAGRVFVVHALEIIQAFRRAVHEAHEAKHNEPSRLRIGMSSFLPLHLMDLLRSVQLRLYRNLSLEIVTAYSLELLALVQKCELDVALVTSPPPNAQITSLCIVKDPFMIAFREAHPLASRTSVTLEELVPFPWVFFNRNVHYHTFADFRCIARGALFLLLAASECNGESQQSNDGEGTVLHREPPQNVCGIVWLVYAGKSMSCVK